MVCLSYKILVDYFTCARNGCFHTTYSFNHFTLWMLAYLCITHLHIIFHIHRHWVNSLIVHLMHALPLIYRFNGTMNPICIYIEILYIIYYSLFYVVAVCGSIEAICYRTEDCPCHCEHHCDSQWECARVQSCHVIQTNHPRECWSWLKCFPSRCLWCRSKCKLFDLVEMYICLTIGLYQVFQLTSLINWPILLKYNSILKCLLINTVVLVSL